jgi:hypothetical protein
MADAIFAYKQDDGIEVRGQARVIVVGARYKTLMIEADAIEKRQSEAASHLLSPRGQ